MSVNEKMTAIADAIREKTGSTEALTLDDMASAVPEVFNAGKEAEHDEFWDAAIADSTSGVYRFAGTSWNDVTFRPNKDIILSGSCIGCFYASQITDIVTQLGGHKLILNGVTSGGTMFSNSKVTHIPVLDLSDCTTISNLCSWCSDLVTIDGITFPTSSTATVTNAFQGCTALTDITVNGEIVISGLDFKQSKNLSVKSLRSILEALSLDVSGKSITLSTSHQAKIEADAECTTYASKATNAGWTIAYN